MDDDGDLFGLDPAADPAPREPAAPGGPRRAIALAAAGAAVAVVAALLMVAGPGSPSPAPAGSTTPGAAPASVSTTSPPPNPPPATTPPPAPTVAADVLAAERAELADTAALLDSPVTLRSPAGWEQWLPAGKPYPGADTDEDIATCPRLAAGLGDALGVRMSYWTGTLPSGPVGCTWATVPLSYDGPYDYAYVLSVGYLADGTTTEDWRHHFYEHQGAICPDVDVPAAGPGAVLVRCVNETTGYALLVPDARRPGVWFLQADTRAHAGHPASYALTALVDGVRAAYG